MIRVKGLINFSCVPVGMRKIFALFALAVLVAAAVFVGPQLVGSVVNDRPTIRVATWNIENFGQKKASDAQLMAAITDVLDEYDVIAIQEISNVDERSDDGCARNADACPGQKCGL